jgi:uncharacterized protein (DUF2252 family)
VGFVVSEVSPYSADLDWTSLHDVSAMCVTLDQLGRATAKVHCVSDVDTGETPLVEFQTEEAIVNVIGDGVEDFVSDLVEFGMTYGEQARRDHVRFVDAFRAGRIPGVTSAD